VLFLCTGNSARSIMAEYLLRRTGKGRFETYSAGSQPTGQVHPLTLRVLREFFHIDARDARSKSWDEFRDQKFDLVITVCDHARDACPYWPGAGYRAHWGSPDPAGAEGTEDERLNVFRNVGLQIQRRVELLCNLPTDSLDHAAWRTAVTQIGRHEPTSSS
jgi:protein-tyrosine-phosphatase